MFKVPIKRTGIALLSVWLGAMGPAFSQTANSGRTAFDFLRISPITRAVGVGEAYTALGDDIGAIYYNPAGLASLLTNELNVTYLSLYQGINYEFVAFGFPLKPSFGDMEGTIGIAANFLQPGSQQRTNDFGVTTGSFSSGDSAFTLSYARTLSKFVQAGISVKYLQQTIDIIQGSLFDVDAGIVVLPPFDGMRVGISLKDMGAQASGFNLPFNLNTAISYRRYELFSEQDDGALTAEAIFPLAPIEDKFGMRAGAEYNFKWVGSRATLRAGYTFLDKDLSGVGLTVGAGYGLDFTGTTLFLDYAFAPADIFGVTNRLSLTAKF